MHFFGIGLHVVVAVLFAIHAVRTNQPLYWLFILFLFPLLGSLVYGIAIWLPEMRQHRGVRKVGNNVRRLFDPSRELREATHAPVASVIDVAQQISITRLGQRVRVSGGRLLSHPDTTPDPATLRRLYDALLDWFPGAARLTGPKSGLQEWQGTCAVLPDGLPLIGPTRVPGVWLNVGHGEAGWSLACGAAGILADEMAGQASPGEARPFQPTARGL